MQPEVKEVAGSKMFVQPDDVKIDVNSMAKEVQDFSRVTDFMKSPIAMLGERHISSGPKVHAPASPAGFWSSAFK
jgi:hypothetical protein